MFAGIPTREPRLKPHVYGENHALPANFNLLSPTSLSFPLAQGAADKPAELARAEFRGRAGLSHFERTSANLPAGAIIFNPLVHGREKQHLPFHVGRNFSPPLFKALHGPNRNSQELGNCFLGFVQPLTNSQELFGFHRGVLHWEIFYRLNFFLDTLYHVVLQKETLFLSCLLVIQPLLSTIE